MKKLLTLLLLSILCLPLPAQQKVRFMPNGNAQAQFAGYYVAKEKGFFEEEGLDVEIRHQGRNSTKGALSHLYDSSVDIITMQLIPALLQRIYGRDIVNILQTSQNSSLIYISHSALPEVDILNGKKVALKVNNYNQIASMMCAEEGVYIDWVPSFQPKNLFISGAVDAILGYSYNDGLSILFSTGGIPEENVIHLSDIGFSCPEDGLYTTDHFMKLNPGVKEKFVRACKKGWEYSDGHREEALDITMKYVAAEKTMTDRAMQRMVLDEILRLMVNPKSSKMDFSKPDAEMFDNFIDLIMKHGYEDCTITYDEFIK